MRMWLEGTTIQFTMDFNSHEPLNFIVIANDVVVAACHSVVLSRRRRRRLLVQLLSLLRTSVA